MRNRWMNRMSRFPWVLGAGCWVLGAGSWGLGAIPSPQPPAPSTQYLLLPTTCLPQIDDERRAPVQSTRFLAAVVVLRPLLTVAHRAQPIGGHAAADEVVLHGVRATVPERQVV